MILTERIALMKRLGAYFLSDDKHWQKAKTQAYNRNPWFIPEYINYNAQHLSQHFLNEEKLKRWLDGRSVYHDSSKKSPEVGIVMAGNIPLVGFHDFLSVFLFGCRQRIKLSSKDTVLWQHIIDVLKEWAPEVDDFIYVDEQLKNCDAYVATGSNNSAHYFEYYFSKYPHIIRRNRSSIAVLTGLEDDKMLAGLASDICLYFGMGCRNVTQLFVPKGYDFNPLKHALKTYEAHLNYSRYKNNYDYQIALMLLNKINYQIADPVLLVPSDSLFAPLSVVHYVEYENESQLLKSLPDKDSLQCVISNKAISPAEVAVIPFGKSQKPRLTDYADGADILAFLESLKIS